jgi:hypothetical protein
MQKFHRSLLTSPAGYFALYYTPLPLPCHVLYPTQNKNLRQQAGQNRQRLLPLITSSGKLSPVTFNGNNLPPLKQKTLLKELSVKKIEQV